MLHASTFDDMEAFQMCKVGDEIEVKYMGTNKIGKLLLGRCDRLDNDDEENERDFNDIPYDDE